MKILLVGDSHINSFEQFQGTVKFNSPTTITAERIVDSTFTNLWNTLDPWLKENGKDSVLLLSAGSVDIRTQYWQELPTIPHVDVADYIQQKVAEFYTKLLEMVDTYQLSRIVLWGPPPAGVSDIVDAEWPFVGPIKSRNRLIHEFNRSFIELLELTSVLGFASGFYDYIDTDQMTTLDDSLSDGINWNTDFTNEFWQNLIMPALLNDCTTILNNDNNYLSSINLLPCSIGYFPALTRGYDTWVQETECTHDTTNDIKVNIGPDQKSFVFMKSTDVPKVFTEVNIVNGY